MNASRIFDSVFSRPPPGWLFQRSVANWMLQPELRGQFPYPLRLFLNYSAWYWKVRPGADYVKAGRHVLQMMYCLHDLLRCRNEAVITMHDLKACLHIRDARFIQVINELRGRGDTAVLRKFLGPGDTFLDIGANQGAYSIVAADCVGPEGIVISVEPQPRLASVLRKTVKMSACRQWEVWEMALGDADRRLAFFEPAVYSGRGGIHEAYSSSSACRTYDVRMGRLDEVLPWRSFTGRVFMKVDVEGAEYAFLEGAAEMIRAKKPALMMEINHAALSAAQVDLDKLRDLLGRLGYRHFLDPRDVSVSYDVCQLSDETDRNVIFT